MASSADTVTDSTQTNENPDTETQSLMEFADREWSPGILFGRKRFRRITDDYSEIYVEETGDWEDTEADFQVKYREGRLGPSDQLEYGKFNDLENAVEYAEIITNGKADLEELR